MPLRYRTTPSDFIELGQPINSLFAYALLPSSLFVNPTNILLPDSNNNQVARYRHCSKNTYTFIRTRSDSPAIEKDLQLGVDTLFLVEA